MSRRALSWLLFAVFFVLLPVPFIVMGGIAWAPLLRLTALAGLMGVLGILDGVNGLMGIALTVVLVQAVLLSVLVWLLVKLCLLVARALGGERVQRFAVLILALVLMVASLFPIYATPTSSTGSPSNVFELLD